MAGAPPTNPLGPPAGVEVAPAPRCEFFPLLCRQNFDPALCAFLAVLLLLLLATCLGQGAVDLANSRCRAEEPRQPEAGGGSAAAAEKV
mmetsp:Transcript_74980/g.232723  ORF Transcript_74980/g.232723 Transcript_74980/m.232723 type:complete len:89 (-) Transcript_74980:80-346(-)